MSNPPLQSRQPRPAESVQRALQVLRMFLKSDPGAGLSVTQTARALDVSKSTVSRLMSTMAAEGFLTLDPATHRYHVGPVAFEVGSRMTVASVARAMTPVVQALAEATAHASQLGTLKERKVLYLAVADGTERVRVVASPGDTRYAHTSAMGKALIAALPGDEQSQLIESLLDSEDKLPVTGPNTISDPAVLREELDVIRRRGYSVSREEAAAGVSAVGVIVPGSRSLRMAMSVSFPSGRYATDDYPALAEKIQGAAREAALVAGMSIDAATDVQKGTE